MNPQYIVISLFCALLVGVFVSELFHPRPDQTLYRVNTAVCEDQYLGKFEVQYLAEAPDDKYEEELCRLYQPGTQI